MNTHTRALQLLVDDYIKDSLSHLNAWDRYNAIECLKTAHIRCNRYLTGAECNKNKPSDTMNRVITFIKLFTEEINSLITRLSAKHDNASYIMSDNEAFFLITSLYSGYLSTD